MPPRVESRADVLFVGHDAGRTGAPIVLLHFQDWLRRRSDLRFATLLVRGGPLEDEYRRLGPTYVLRPEPADWGPTGRLATRIRGGHRVLSWNHRRRLRAELAPLGPRLIYANTAATGPGLRFLSSAKCPVVTHVHELESGLQHPGLVGPKNLAVVTARTREFVAASEAVRENLVGRHGVDGEIVTVVHEFIPTDRWRRAADSEAGAAARAELGIAAEAFVVGGAGSLIRRKGPDLFVRVASAVLGRSADRPIHFLWVGGGADPDVREHLDEVVRRDGLGGRVHFVGPQASPERWFAAMDVLALTSREDPYPLVMLEAAAAGRPVLCFSGAGGAPEFVEPDCGYAVPFEDAEAMAQRVLELAADPSLCRSLGLRAAEKVARHDVEVAAPRLLDVIRRNLAPS